MSALSGSPASGRSPRRTGSADLPLHGGAAPRWLFARMVHLAREILGHLVADYGPDEVLHRLSDPHWFQALGCVLGFDWHSSGLTTTTCGALKEAVAGREDDLGLYVAGGKGAASRRTPGELETIGERLGRDPAALVHASRMAAKVDNTAVQDGYQLYQHTFVHTRGGRWCVVQQGMNTQARGARRYHWLGERVASLVDEPHAAVCCDRRVPTLNLVARESAEARAGVTEVAAARPTDTLRALAEAPRLVMPRRHRLTSADIDPRRLGQVLLRTYQHPPADFEELLGVRGVGPKALRALALVAELLHGARASTRDPARFAFAHGGKDGTPYPVDRATYEHTISVLHRALERAHVERSEKIKAFRRLARLAGPGTREHP